MIRPTNSSLKSRVISKFGSVENFCKITGEDSIKMEIFFAAKDSNLISEKEEELLQRTHLLIESTPYPGA